MSSNVLCFEGDLLEAKVDAIVQQCNCVTRNAAGLALAIFTAYPAANTYGANPREDMYGDWEVRWVEGAPFQAVINLYTQLNPGRSRNMVGIDSPSDRLMTFGRSLRDIVDSSPAIIETFAFPKGFGCGLAGGNWSDYFGVIKDVAIEHPECEFQIIEKV